MPGGTPAVGTLGPPILPFSLPQNLSGTSPYITATANQTTASVTLVASNIGGFTDISIYRIVGSSRTVTRQATDVQTGGAATGTFVDTEAPLGVSVTYVLQGDGNDVATSNAVTLAYAINTYWIKDVSNSNLNTLVEVSNMGDITRPSRILVKTNVLGRQNAHIVNDVRGGREGTMVLSTDNATEQAQILALFADGGTLFFQCPPNYQFPDMYFVSGDLKESWEGSASEGVHSFSFDFTEVDAPASTTNSSTLNTYLNVTNFGTYQNLLNKRATYQLVRLNPWVTTDGTG